MAGAGGNPRRTTLMARQRLGAQRASGQLDEQNANAVAAAQPRRASGSTASVPSSGGGSYSSVASFDARNRARVYEWSPAAIALLAVIVAIEAGTGYADEQVFALASTVFVLVAVCGMYAWYRVTAAVTDEFLTVSGVLLGLGIALMDIASASEGSLRMWPLAVSVVSIMFMTQAPSRLIVAFTALTAFWLFITSADTALRVGLYDMPGLTSQDHRWRAVCGCTDLPCKRNSGWLEFIFGAAVMGSNFVVLRVFAGQVAQEHARMRAAIDTANRVADQFVTFDLEEAQCELQRSAGTLPDGLQDAFYDLLANLHEYRPYLPRTLWDLKRAHSAPPGDTPLKTGKMHPPPGLDSAKPSCAIMFTDVRASTRIWRQRPTAMQEALRLHNIVVRQCIADFCGYEVKTIGDAFMIATATAADAVRCGLQIQKEMLAVQWPEALLEVPECAPEPSGLWRGLALRIGIDYGTLLLEKNVITCRYDYFGDVVNRAARIEAVCPPGAVASRQELMGPVIDDVGEACVCTHTYEAVLKGFEDDDDEVMIKAVVPASLSGRGELLHEDWTDKVIGSTTTPPGRDRIDFAESVRLEMSRRQTDGVVTIDLDPNTPLPLGPVASMMHRPASSSWLTMPHNEQRPATVGAVLVRIPSGASDYLHRFFPRLLHCLQITGGTVFTTVHDLIILSWGATSPMASHQEAAANFVRLFREARLGERQSHTTQASALTVGNGATSAASSADTTASTSTTGRDYHMALSSSSVVVDDVGGATQRFVTLYGAAVPLVLKTVRLAEQLKIHTLYASPQASEAEFKHLRESVRLMGILVHCVQEIMFPWLDDAAHIIRMYEMRLRSDPTDVDERASTISRNTTASVSFFGKFRNSMLNMTGRNSPTQDRDRASTATATTVALSRSGSRLDPRQYERAREMLGCSGLSRHSQSSESMLSRSTHVSLTPVTPVDRPYDKSVA